MELKILTALCGLTGLGCLAGAGYAVLGSEDVGVEQIFLLLTWGLFGIVFLGMAQWIARLGPLKDLGKKRVAAPETETAPNTPPPA